MQKAKPVMSKETIEKRTESLESNSDASSMINSIRTEVKERSREINQRAEEKIERIRSSIEAEIEEFTIEKENEIDKEIENEISRINNRASIEKRKLKLRVIDSFINSMIMETADEFRKGGAYKDFIERYLVSSLSGIKGRSVTVLLSEDDMGLGEDIAELVRSRCNYDGDLKIRDDESIEIGGFIIVDEEKGVTFNNTLERIIFRKNDRIRKEVISILEECRGLK